jgi:AmmeMemoRadiSam system protein B
MDLHFENKSILKAALAGSAYEADPQKLRQDFGVANIDIDTQSAKKAGETKASNSGLPTVLFAPHIDFRVEKALYKKAFESLPAKKFSRVLVIGTSHYAGYFPDTYENSPFIGSSKDFESPLGTLKSAQDWVEKLAANSCTDNLGLSFQDRAYQPEHSVEFHLILTQLYLGNDLDYFPILVNGLDDLMYTDLSEQAIQLEIIAKTLNKLIFEYPNPEEILILVSGDLAHIGPRFGDEEDAKIYFEGVSVYDTKFLKCIADLDYNGLLKLMRSNNDAFNHCGFPPALLALKMLQNTIWEDGLVLGREQWYEDDDQSLVSYGAVLLTNKQTN